MVRSKSLLLAEVAVGVEIDAQDAHPVPHCSRSPEDVLVAVVVAVVQAVVVAPVVLHPVSVEQVVLQLAEAETRPANRELATAVVGQTTSQLVTVSVSEQERDVVVVNAEISQPVTVLVDVVQDVAACLLRPGADAAEHFT